jgi:hypothetical protein
MLEKYRNHNIWNYETIEEQKKYFDYLSQTASNCTCIPPHVQIYSNNNYHEITRLDCDYKCVINIGRVVYYIFWINCYECAFISTSLSELGRYSIRLDKFIETYNKARESNTTIGFMDRDLISMYIPELADEGQ